MENEKRKKKIIAIAWVCKTQGKSMQFTSSIKKGCYIVGLSSAQCQEIL
jgi:hypothetical protein